MQSTSIVLSSLAVYGALIRESPLAQALQAFLGTSTASCWVAVRWTYQQQMYDRNVNRMDDRIVNFAQPQLRPIAWGKAGVKTECGAKQSASDDHGFIFLDRLEWDAYNESSDRIPRVETYKQDKGFYPKRVCANQIDMIQADRMFCNENGIRLSKKIS